MSGSVLILLLMFSQADAFRLRQNSADLGNRTAARASDLYPLDVPVIIKSHRNQNLKDENGQVKLTETADAWEKWVISDAGNGKVTIRSHRDQNLQDNGGQVRLSGSEMEWEQWTISDAGNGKVTIKSHRDKYLKDSNGQVQLSENSDEWEQWSIALPPKPTPLPGERPDDAFTLVVIPDTQFMTFNTGWGRSHPRLAWPEKWHSQAEWVVANKDLLNIKGIVHVGDLVEQGCNDGHWDNFNHGWNQIQATGIPYSFSPGNHDCDRVPGCYPRGWDCYNKHVPQHLDKVPFHVEFMSPGNYQNMITLFEASGLKFIIVAVEYNTPGDAVEWARKKVEQYSDRWAIFNAHYFQSSPGFFDLAKSHPKTFMLTQGHACVHGQEWHKFHQGAGEQPFIEILVDYQCNSNGFLKYFTIDKVAGKVKGHTYNPYTKEFRRGGNYEYSWDFKF